MSLQSFLSTSVRKVLGSLTHVVTPSAVLALTFDDGPDPENTPKVLALLEKYQARGTFFVVGQAAAVQPALVQRIAAGGHAIGIHSWDHRAFPGLTSRSVAGKSVNASAHCGPMSAHCFVRLMESRPSCHAWKRS